MAAKLLPSRVSRNQGNRPLLRNDWSVYWKKWLHYPYNVGEGYGFYYSQLLGVGKTPHFQNPADTFCSIGQIEKCYALADHQRSGLCKESCRAFLWRCKP